MDLLHAYSKQPGRTPPPRELIGKASRSRRSAEVAPAVRRAPQLRPDEVESLLAHYREHRSVAGAANALGVTRQTAGRHLAESGISTAKGMTEVDIARAREARDAGESANSIGRMLGFSPHTIIKALRPGNLPST